MEKKYQRGRREASVENEGGEREILIIFSFLVFFFRFMKIGSSDFIGDEGKINLRDESYVWTPKSWSFDKFCEAGVLSYLFYPLFKCFVNACVGLRP